MNSDSELAIWTKILGWILASPIILVRLTMSILVIIWIIRHW